MKDVVPLYAPERKREPHPDLQPADLAAHLLSLSYDVSVLGATLRFMHKTEAWNMVPRTVARNELLATVADSLSTAARGLVSLKRDIEDHLPPEDDAE